MPPVPRKAVNFTYDKPGRLGVHLGTAYHAVYKEVVVVVENIDSGSVIEQAGVEVGDWLTVVNGEAIDVWGHADEQGRVDEKELAELLDEIRSLDPTPRPVGEAAHELMERYDHDRSNYLEPEELVNLINDDLLDSIFHLVQTRPLNCTFTRDPPTKRRLGSNPAPPPPPNAPTVPPTNVLAAAPAAAPATSRRGGRKRRLSMSIYAPVDLEKMENEAMKKALRKRVVVSIPTRDPLGIEIVSAYVAKQNRIVVDVTHVSTAGQMHTAGVREYDWLLEIGDISIDLMNQADTDHDGKVSTEELEVLLGQIHKLAHDDPNATGWRSATELMEEFDLDHSNNLDPSELVNLINHVLLDAIVKIIGNAERPTQFVFSRRDEEAIIAANAAANRAVSVAYMAVRVAERAKHAASDARDEASHHATATARKKKVLGGSRAQRKRRSSMVGSAKHGYAISGMLSKKAEGVVARWQPRFFKMQTHYLCYKKNVGDAEFAGGVDIQGSSASIELINKGTILKVTGLDAEVHDPVLGRQLRTFMLKAGTAAKPTLVEWYDAIIASRQELREVRVGDPNLDHASTVLAQAAPESQDERQRRLSAGVGLHLIPTDHMESMYRAKQSLQRGSVLYPTPENAEMPAAPIFNKQHAAEVAAMSAAQYEKQAVADSGSTIERSAPLGRRSAAPLPPFASVTNGSPPPYTFPQPELPPPALPPPAGPLPRAPLSLSTVGGRQSLDGLTHACRCLAAKSSSPRVAFWTAMEVFVDESLDRIPFDVFAMRFHDYLRDSLSSEIKIDAKTIMAFFQAASVDGISGTTVAQLESAMAMLFCLPTALTSDIVFKACAGEDSTNVSGTIGQKAFVNAARVVYGVGSAMTGRASYSSGWKSQTTLTTKDAEAMFDEMLAGSANATGARAMTVVQFRTWYALTWVTLGLDELGEGIAGELKAPPSVIDAAKECFGPSWDALSSPMKRSVLQNTAKALPLAETKTHIPLGRVDAIARVRTFYGDSWQYVSGSKKRELIAAAQADSTMFADGGLPQKREQAAAQNKFVSAGMRRGLVVDTQRTASSSARSAASPVSPASRAFLEAQLAHLQNQLHLVKGENLREMQRSKYSAESKLAELRGSGLPERLPSPTRSASPQVRVNRRGSVGIALGMSSQQPTAMRQSNALRQQVGLPRSVRTAAYAPHTAAPQVHVNRRGSVDITLGASSQQRAVSRWGQTPPPSIVLMSSPTTSPHARFPSYSPSDVLSASQYSTSMYPVGYASPPVLQRPMRSTPRSTTYAPFASRPPTAQYPVGYAPTALSSAAPALQHAAARSPPSVHVNRRGSIDIAGAGGGAPYVSPPRDNRLTASFSSPAPAPRYATAGGSPHLSPPRDYGL